MERSEAASLVAMLQAAYQREMPEPTAKLYTEFMLDLDAEQASIAVRSLVASSKWLPSVSEIREQTVQQEQDVLLAEEAWPIGEAWACGRDSYRDTSTMTAHLIDRALDAMGRRTIADSLKSDHWPREQFIRIYNNLREKSMRGYLYLPSDLDALDAIRQRELAEVVTKELSA